MSVKMELKGDKALIKALANIGGTKGKAAMRKGTRDNQKMLCKTARKYMRKQSGAMIKNTKVRSMKKSRVRQGHTTNLTDLPNGVFYGGFQEWGTKKKDGSQRIEPMEAFKKAADELGVKAIEGTEQVIWQEVKRLWGSK
jgi:hypothetical protein